MAPSTRAIPFFWMLWHQAYMSRVCKVATWLSVQTFEQALHVDALAWHLQTCVLAPSFLSGGLKFLASLLGYSCELSHVLFGYPPLFVALLWDIPTFKNMKSCVTQWTQRYGFWWCVGQTCYCFYSFTGRPKVLVWNHHVHVCLLRVHNLFF